MHIGIGIEKQRVQLKNGTALIALGVLTTALVGAWVVLSAPDTLKGPFAILLLFVPILLVSLRDARPALWAFIFLLPMGLLGVIPETGRSMIIPMGGALAVATALHLARTGHRLVIPWQLWILGVFVALAGLSSLLGSDPERSVKPWSTQVMLFVLVFITVQLVKTWWDLERVLWAMWASLSVISVYTLLVHQGVFDLAVSETFTHAGVTRVSSFAGGTGTTGMLAGMGLVLTICLWQVTIRRRVGLLLFVPLICMGIFHFMALLFTVSLNPILATALVIPLALPAMWRPLKLTTLIKGFMLLGALFFLFSPIQERVELQAERLQTNTHREWFTTRVDSWLAAGELALDNPLLGVGSGNMGRDVIPYLKTRSTRFLATPDAIWDAHSSFMSIAANHGLLGLALFLLALIGIIKAAYAAMSALARSGGRDMAILAWTAFLVLLMLLISSMGRSMHDWPYLWLFMALCLVIPSLLTRPDNSSAPGSAATNTVDDIPLPVR